MLLQRKYQFLLLLILSVVSFSCGKESACFKSTGKIITEQRAITNDVLKIITEDNIDIVITQSTEASLMLAGGANILPFIKTEISGNELHISSDNKCGFFRNYDTPLTVYISIANLTDINYTGQGIITSANTLNFPEFRFESRQGTGSINLEMNSNNVSVVQHTGPADITVSGTTNNLYAYAGENGWHYLKDLSCINAHVNNGGSGDVSVTVSNNLLIELTYLGNIDYYTTPNNITVSVHTGSGELRQK